MYSQRHPVGRKMARPRVKQIDLKSWEYTKIHFLKSAYWSRFLKTLLKFRDPLTGGPGSSLDVFFFPVDLFSLCNSFLDLYSLSLNIYIYKYQTETFSFQTQTQKLCFPMVHRLFLYLTKAQGIHIKRLIFQ